MDSVCAGIWNTSWSWAATENVALGGDWDGCDPVAGGFHRHLESGSDFYEELLRCNYPESLVRDLFWNNLMRSGEDSMYYVSTRDHSPPVYRCPGHCPGSSP